MRRLLLIIFQFSLFATAQNKFIIEDIPGFDYSIKDLTTGKIIDFIDCDPSISPDGKYMIFKRGLTNEDWGYYESELIDGKWTLPRKIDFLTKSEKELIFQVPPVRFNKDGTEIFFAANYTASLGDQDFYRSLKKNGIWQPPTHIGPPLSSKAYDGAIDFSVDGTTAFFKRASYGEEPKIYFARKSNGQWGIPELWFPDLSFYHVENPLVLGNNALIFYGQKDKKAEHFFYLSVLDEDKWSIPIKLEFSFQSSIRDWFVHVSSSDDFQYIYFGGGKLKRARVPESYRQLVLAANSKLDKPVDSKITEHISEVQTVSPSGDKLADVSPRIALVIGNSAYQVNPLNNPSTDASAIAAELELAGFEVIRLIDGTREQIRKAIRDFGDRLHMKRGVGLFYYAGHGIQLNGSNYLVPIDADIERAYEIPDQCIQVDHVTRMMELYDNPLNIIILDACRNNPYASSFRDMKLGLAQPSAAPKGTLIAYATSPGKVASDGEGVLGLYTSELLKAMRTKGSSIEEIFKQVRISVIDKSDGKQVPWENSSLIGDFYFYPDK